MFTGIIRNFGKLIKFRESSEGVKFLIESELFLNEEIKIGDSIAVNGVCLTVVKKDKTVAEFDLLKETVAKTSFKDLKENAILNLERSLRFGDGVDGNLVQGHVDCVCSLLAKEEIANTFSLELSLPAEVRGLVVEKGAVTLDGVALTVGKVGEKSFFIYVIPHTLKNTNIGNWEIGSKINLEADCIARYVKAQIVNYEI
ncbi:MAG: riboflavin synthase [Proteobacteria bacterium]|nr:riboflavin synthase [Pseudomonadota bacterium]